MLKPEGTPIDLVFPGPGGRPIPAGTGTFHDIGTYPNTNQLFFDMFNGGKELYLEGTGTGPGNPGVRAQIGGGEGHVEVSLSPAIMNAAKDPNNPWKITPDDVSQANINYTLFAFMGIYGRDGNRSLGLGGINQMLDMYGQGHDERTAPKPPTPPSPSNDEEIGKLREEVDTLKSQITATKRKLQTASVDLAGKLPEKGGIPIQKLVREVRKLLAVIDGL